jgi:preprotein translocase subunit SecG
MIRPQVYDTADDVPLQEKITEKNYQENLSSEQEQGSFESAESNKNNFWRLIWFLAIIVIVLILIFKKWYNKFAR